MVRRALLGALVALAPLPAFARCPASLSPEEEFRASKTVVVGPVVGERYIGASFGRPEGFVYTVRVQETLRGDPGKTVMLFSALRDPDLAVKKGRTYVLFLRGDGEAGTVRPCGNSGPLPERDDVLPALRALAGSRK